MQDILQKFLEIKTELEDAKPITLNLSAAETFGVITILQLAKVAMPGLESYLRIWRKKLNGNDILLKLRDSKDITITMSAVESFYLVTTIQLIKADDLENSITVILADEAGKKIISALAKNT